MTYAGNPLKSGGSYATLPGGTYVFFFTGHKMKTVEKTAWTKVNGKPVGTPVPGQTEEKIYLWFEREDAAAGTVRAFKKFYPTCGKKSDLIKTMRQMAPGKITDENCNDADLMWALLQDLTGDPFMLTIEPSNGFNNILSICPPPEGMTVAGSTPKRAAGTPLGTEQIPLGANAEIDDSDIPF